MSVGFLEEVSKIYNGNQTSFIKIILDSQIKFRDKQLKNFLILFRKVDFYIHPTLF